MKKKINLIFRIDQGKKQNIVLDYGTTINKAFIKFLKTIGKPELIGENEDKIGFIFGATHINFWDQRRTERVFPSNSITEVFINGKKSNNPILQNHNGKNFDGFHRNNSEIINFNQISQFNFEIKNLKKLLEKEKEKNKILNKENYNLKL